MTPRTPQCEVFWPLLSNSKHSGVPEDSKSPTLGVGVSPSHFTQSRVATINKGQITFIPKSGDQARLGNWRPITLLGNLYKILAKVLAGRVQTVLPHVIRPNQTGFVERRSIFDNVFMM